DLVAPGLGDPERVVPEIVRELGGAQVELPVVVLPEGQEADAIGHGGVAPRVGGSVVSRRARVKPGHARLLYAPRRCFLTLASPPVPRSPPPCSPSSARPSLAPATPAAAPRRRPPDPPATQGRPTPPA